MRTYATLAGDVPSSNANQIAVKPQRPIEKTAKFHMETRRLTSSYAFVGRQTAVSHAVRCHEPPSRADAKYGSPFVRDSPSLKRTRADSAEEPAVETTGRTPVGRMALIATATVETRPVPRRLPAGQCAEDRTLEATFDRPTRRPSAARRVYRQHADTAENLGHTPNDDAAQSIFILPASRDPRQ